MLARKVCVWEVNVGNPELDGWAPWEGQTFRGDWFAGINVNNYQSDSFRSSYLKDTWGFVVSPISPDQRIGVFQWRSTSLFDMLFGPAGRVRPFDWFITPLAQRQSYWPMCQATNVWYPLQRCVLGSNPRMGSHCGYGTHRSHTQWMGVQDAIWVVATTLNGYGAEIVPYQSNYVECQWRVDRFNDSRFESRSSSTGALLLSILANL